MSAVVVRTNLAGVLDSWLGLSEATELPKARRQAKLVSVARASIGNWKTDITVEEALSS
jgi:hypothetical protein